MTCLAAGARVVGPVTVRPGGGLIATGATIVGPVRLVDSDTGPVAVVVAGNVVTGPLACTGNRPAPVNQGRPNSVTGPATGQCAEL